MLDEQLHNIHVAVPRSIRQRIPVEREHVCAVLEEELNDGQMAIRRCTPQRAASIISRAVIAAVYVSAVLDEELDNAYVTIV